MSAPALTRSTVRVPTVGSHDPLRALEGAATTSVRVPGAGVRAGSASASSTSGSAEAPHGARVPRRVRLARTLLLGIVLIAVLVGVFAAAWSPSAAADDEGVAAGTVTVVVAEGESLWSVVGDRGYDRDPRVVIDEVHTLNGMESSVVHPGQRLVLPAR
ncbi:hypothetical protein [Brevibacterium jeotgali]|uniref:LysM domain-containing protein n=1 Tax=Brevibacterium jeotgali TaxID=1262550 RepID=A0A2H1L374_9MICO|nr:hypothetical protein [Brevibacterium jeotgali]TWC02554.1 hypothetical protein FB108_1232 [Brevibacterium jeotgali]SMY11346.1 hypothetical protein BJEO58_00931 [Brevibacterium jeotgali]